MTAELQDLRPTFEAEKVVEQEYFDQAKEALDQAIASSGPLSSGSTAFERRALSAAAQRRQRLGADEAVAFGRIDLDDAETRYIGKVAIRNADGDILVYQWQSPAAELYNLASIDDPQGVARKRVYHAPKNRIESFQDILFRQLSEDLEQLEQFSSSTDPLLDELSRQRGTHMQDIVRTIEAAQSKLVRADKDQLLVIQGGPGTGKTAVALHRVSWLLFNFQSELAPQDVLVVGPNPTFTKYIQRVLPDLGDENVVQQSLDQLLAGSTVVRGSDDARTARLKGSLTMAGIVARALNQRIRVPLAGLKFRLRNSAMTSSVDSSDIESALKALRSGTFSERRAQLRSALLQVAHSSSSYLGSVDPENLYDPASIEAEIEKVWPQLSPHQFVRELYGSKERLKAAGANNSQAEALYRPAQARIGEELWTSADLAVLDQAMHAIQGVTSSYGHIVVDEAQDLSVMQLKAIRRRSRSGSMTIVGDIAQSTSAYARQNWSQVLKELESDLPANLEILEMGYRVPRQVFDVATKVLSVAAPDIPAPRILRDVPELPRWILSAPGTLSDSVVDAVQEHSAKGLFVGVIANKQLWPALQKSFHGRGTRWSESADGGLSQGINLVTPEDSKGLEFDAVVVVDPLRILNETQGARLLYVALTRTVHYLDVVIPEGKVPDVLAEFVPSLSSETDIETLPEADRDLISEGTPEDEVVSDNTKDDRLTPEVEYHAEPPHTVISAATNGVAVLRQRDEAYAQLTADEIFAELQQTAGPTVQRRVLQLLTEKAGLIGP
ncbi:HelD family protein [Arthrobacter globiformis]|uniref:HelD family protein n=1 Tax=Arthrobacter globiformis TaxID=1665 RepID=UPI0027810FAA|nr:UvrD-helicase domain-containing protein [Arthrobacter globiformis]MDQ0863780.1 DNA helicase IV [Arthrobacter globiformis]